MPATLALTMGTPASFGPFTPGLGKDYSPPRRRTSSPPRVTRRSASPTRHDRHRPPGQRHVLAAVAAAGGRHGRRRPTRRRRLGRADDAEDLYTGPVSNDPVTVSFKQPIARHRPAAHGRLHEDADVHAVDDDPVAVCSRRRSRPRDRRFGVWHFGGPAFPSRGRDPMAESVYRVTEVIGVSSDSWEAAAKGCGRHRREDRARPARRRSRPSGCDDRRRRRGQLPRPARDLVQVRQRGIAPARAIARSGSRRFFCAPSLLARASARRCA